MKRAMVVFRLLLCAGTNQKDLTPPEAGKGGIEQGEKPWEMDPKHDGRGRWFLACLSELESVAPLCRETWIRRTPGCQKRVKEASNRRRSPPGTIPVMMAGLLVLSKEQMLQGMYPPVLVSHVVWTLCVAWEIFVHL